MKKEKNMTKIAAVVSSLTLGAEKKTDDALLFDLAIHWKMIVGDDLFKHSAPLSLQKGKLTIGLTDPTLVFQCQTMKSAWTQKMNAYLKAAKITDIQFKLM